jgi:hypothetical protein
MAGTEALSYRNNQDAVLPQLMPTDGARRSDAIAIARVICILGVVYVHAWTGANGEALALLRGTAQDNLRWTLMEAFGRSAVPLLGLISGWLVQGSGRTRDWAAHVQRKARTILLPMALWNALAILFVSGAALTLGLAAPVPKSLWWAVDEILIITRNPDINVQMPFLRDLFLCMVAAPLLVRLPGWMVAIVALLAGAAQIAGLGPPVLMRASILFFFALGMLVRRGGWEERVVRWPLIATVLPFAILMLFQLYRATLLDVLPNDGGAWAPRALDLALRLAAAVAFWRLAWIVAGSRLRGPMLRIEPFAFFLFCAHLILIWLGGPFLGHVFGRMGSPLYPVYLILQPAMVAAVVIPFGLLLRRYTPRAARILSGGRL